MNQPERNRIIAGLGLLAVVIAMFTFSFFAADIKAAFVKRYSIVAVFHSAPQLRVGSPVWIGGHEVGRVTSIGFRALLPDSAPSVAVLVELPRKYSEHVRRDSEIKLTSERTIGEPAIDISPGSAQQPALADGDTLFAPPPNPMALLEGLTSMLHSFDSLVASAHALTPIAKRRQAQLNRLAAGLDAVQAEFAALSAAFDNGSGAMLTDPRMQNAFAAIGTTAQQLGAAFDNASKRYSDPALRESFGRLRLRADALSAHIASLGQAFANSSLTRFARDSALTRAMHQARTELDSLMAETKRNPMRYWLGK